MNAGDLSHESMFVAARLAVLITMTRQQVTERERFNDVFVNKVYLELSQGSGLQPNGMVDGKLLKRR